MISFGKNLRQAKDPLTKLSLETTFHKIKAPQQILINYINQIRTVATIDAQKYRQLKLKLPYLVAGIFNPNFRKKDCFAYTNYLILDIDHIQEKEFNLDELFHKITKDQRVVLAFRSPSNDGIKVFFKFHEKCYDSGKYTLFYKYFAHQFSKQYGLDQVIDKTTSDVSRACFVSYDPKAYFNNEAEQLTIDHVINFENEEQISELKFEIKKSEDYLKENKKEVASALDINKQDLPFDMLQKIRETLNPKIKTKRERNVVVPAELDEIVDEIKTKMQEYDIEIKLIKNINYGKQFKFKLKNIWTELNVFYGKRGFIIVQSTKNGSNKELSDTCYAILTNMLY